MKALNSKKLLLPIGLALLLALCLSSAFAGSNVELSEDDRSAPSRERGRNEDSPAWHRKLWNGSFDTASDASGAAAGVLEGLDFGDCEEKYLKAGPGKPANQNLYQACVERKKASAKFAKQARSIQSQQKAFSMISKASDLAAVGTLGATIYGEMVVKQGNQAFTYESAAHIQRKAGEVSYVAGASDFAMGAYAYIAHKNKLEQMKNTVSGSKNGVRADSDATISGALSSAEEAAKKAAYNHMLYGAGKLATGYGMMYLSKQSAAQAERMRSIEEIQEYNKILAARTIANGGAVTAPTPVAAGAAPSAAAQSNQPVISLPKSASSSPTSTQNGPVTYTIPGGGTGSSVPVSPAQARALATAATGKITGGSGGSSGAGEAKLPGAASENGEEAAKDKGEKSAKDSAGAGFEMQLTGGLHNGFSGSSGNSSSADAPNLAAMMGENSASNGNHPGGTAISPSQILRDAAEEGEYSGQGSLPGVSEKKDASLFVITKTKLTKMIRIGNIGMPKNVEVKN